MNKEPFIKWDFINTLWLVVCVPMIVMMYGRPFLLVGVRPYALPSCTIGFAFLFAVTMAYNKKKYGVCLRSKSGKQQRTHSAKSAG